MYLYSLEIHVLLINPVINFLFLISNAAILFLIINAIPKGLWICWSQKASHGTFRNNEMKTLWLLTQKWGESLFNICIYWLFFTQHSDIFIFMKEHIFIQKNSTSYVYDLVADHILMNYTVYLLVILNYIAIFLLNIFPSSPLSNKESSIMKT